MLLDTLRASSLGHLITEKEIKRVGEEIVRASYGNKKDF